MAWTGTGLLWSVSGGVLSSRPIGAEAAEAAGPPATFSFAQISDSHIGFKGEANRDVLATFETAIARIRALVPKPAFLIHTGDITHAQQAGAFDTARQALQSAGVERTFYVPGEHRRVRGRRRGWVAAGRASTTAASTSSTSSTSSPTRRAGWATWAPCSSSGPGVTSRASPAARRSWCSPTCRSGRCTRSGAG
jgi:calcineurin-like phosphoesterase family protein